MTLNLQDLAVFIGLDVGKSEHHATAIDAQGKTIFDQPLPNQEAQLAELLTQLTAEHGPALLVVDQPATIGALPVAVAKAADNVEGPICPD